MTISVDVYHNSKLCKPKLSLERLHLVQIYTFFSEYNLLELVQWTFSHNVFRYCSSRFGNPLVSVPKRLKTYYKWQVFTGRVRLRFLSVIITINPEVTGGTKDLQWQERGRKWWLPLEEHFTNKENYILPIYTAPINMEPKKLLQVLSQPNHSAPVKEEEWQMDGRQSSSIQESSSLPLGLSTSTAI